MKTKIAVIGCGYWGPNLIRNFNLLENSEITWICDKDKERLDYIKRLYPLAETSQEYESVIEEKGVDAVCIATPASTHFGISKKSLLSGKHILVEKPLTLVSEEARKLISIAEGKQRILMVGHTFEHNEAVKKIKSLISEGELGRILYVYMTRVNLGIFRDDVNVVWDLCPHDISILNYILDAVPISVKADGIAHYRKDIEDTAFVFLSYPESITAFLHVSWLDPCKARKVVIVGDKKMAVFDDLNIQEPIKIYDKGVIKQPYYNNFGEFKLAYSFGNVYSPKVENVEPLKNECSHFLDCIQEKKIPISDGKSGLKVVKVLEAVQRSIKDRKEVILNWD